MCFFGFPKGSYVRRLFKVSSFQGRDVSYVRTMPRRTHAPDAARVDGVDHSVYLPLYLYAHTSAFC